MLGQLLLCIRIDPLPRVGGGILLHIAALRTDQEIIETHAGNFGA